MAVLDTLETFAPIREKIEAGERLDFEDGVTLMESDDLLALGELADLARRQRGGGDEVFFVQNLYLNQTNVCRVKCKFCAFAKTQKQEDAYTLTADELVADAAAPVRARAVHRDPLRQRREPARRPRVLRGRAAQAEGGAARRPSQVLHGVRDPPHVEARGLQPRRGAARAQGRGPRLAARRRRGDLRRPRPQADRTGQGASRRLVRRARHGAPARHPDALHDALRPRRDATRSASTTCCACARSRTRPAASSRSSRSRSIRRTRCSSGAASSTRPAPTT